MKKNNDGSGKKVLMQFLYDEEDSISIDEAIKEAKNNKSN
jgi:hypothetical protein